MGVSAFSILLPDFLPFHQMLHPFHGGIAAVVVDVDIVLAGDAAEGDDFFQTCALL